LAIAESGRPIAPGDCFTKALDLLSRRPHFRRELEMKLRKRGFGPEQVESALDRATERGFLDDAQCARDFARVRVERRHDGPAKLFAALSRRGAAADVAREAVAEQFADGESELLERAARRWLSVHEWDRDRLARHLDRKGFSKGEIFSALGRLTSEGSYPGPAVEEVS